MADATHERVNVIFPRELVHELRRLVPRRRRSELIAEATAEKLALLRQQEAVREAAGSWKDEDHPEMQTLDDVHRWLDDLRSSWRRAEDDDPGNNSDVSS